MGDPAGIGPEITLKAIEALQPRLRSGALALTIVGARAAFVEAAARIGRPALAETLAGEGVSLVETAEGVGTPEIGVVSAAGGEHAYQAVARAVSIAMLGEVDAIVTGPLNKEALHMAGYPYAGHTDMLAALTGSADSVMMLIHGPFRVSHVTTHVSLADAAKLLSPERLSRAVVLTSEALAGMGVKTPRIAVAALNPHAGEGGRFGAEDLEITAPTIDALRRKGIDVEGPVSGDTVFVRLRAGQYDAVVAMYHDQGHIPVKLLGFEVDPDSGAWTSLSGVNVTLGLPIIRTSVDHGTAFDIAGTGRATPSSLLEAVDVALELTRVRSAAA